MIPIRRLAQSVLIIFITLIVLAGIAQPLTRSATPVALAAIAAIYTVDETIDSATDTACTNAANDCSLRGAIVMANANPGSIIILPTGIYTLTLSGPSEDANLTGDLDISATVSISGAGSIDTIIQGAPGWTDRLLDIRSGSVQFNGVMLRYGFVGDIGGAVYVHQGGSASISNTIVYSNYAGTFGGGLAISGSLILMNSQLISNTNFFGGGGIYVDVNSTAKIDDSQFVGNTGFDGVGLLNKGQTHISGTLFMHNVGMHEGGAILNTGGGAVVVTNSQLISNTSFQGGGLFNHFTAARAEIVASQVLSNWAFIGGGLYNISSMAVSGTQVAFNTASTGGGIYAEYQSITTIEASVVQDNASTSSGGGLINYGTVLISRTDFVHNSAGGLGGAIAHESGFISIDHGVIADNHSDSRGGGIYTDGGTQLRIDGLAVIGNSANYGGGIDQSYGVLDMTNSTLSGNSAKINGGGLSVSTDFAYAQLNSVTIATNTADSDLNGSGDGGGLYSANFVISMTNVLLGGNADPGGEGPDCAAWILSGGYNLIQSMTGCTISHTLTGVISNTDPLLGPLGNFGSTWAQPLLKNSPAIDAGNPLKCLPFDQRGTPRPIGLTCDIGAIEYQPAYVTYLPLALKNF